MSKSLRLAAAWRNSVLIGGDVITEVRRLKAEAGKDILIDGSSVLLHSLIAAGEPGPKGPGDRTAWAAARKKFSGA